MLNLVDKIEQKLDEYDITIYDQYEIKNNEYVFIAENMLILVYNETSIGVSFQVSTKPEIVGNSLLILGEIENMLDIKIMESFAFTQEKKMVCGEKAYELFQKTMEHNIIQNFETEKYYKQLLLVTEGHKC